MSSPPSGEPTNTAEQAVGEELAIIIVGHNDRTDLGRCLESLFAQPPTVRHQVVVVDNASEDGSVEMIASHWPEVLLLENPTNVGFACAVNRGIRATTSESVLLLNPDTLPDGKAIDMLAATLLDEPSVVAVGPRIVDGEGRPEISWWHHPGPWTEWRLRRLRRAWEGGDSRADQHVEELTRQRREVGWLTGACLMMRRAAAVAAGLMDEAYFLYFDDADLCAALRANGGRILFLPEAEIVHLRGRTVGRRPQETARRYRTSQLHFYRKHHPFWYPWLRLLLRLRGQLPPPAILSEK
jgi:GT2 family glycosyltransferase